MFYTLSLEAFIYIHIIYALTYIHLDIGVSSIGR